MLDHSFSLGTISVRVLLGNSVFALFISVLCGCEFRPSSDRLHSDGEEIHWKYTVGDTTIYDLFNERRQFIATTIGNIYSDSSSIVTEGTFTFEPTSDNSADVVMKFRSMDTNMVAFNEKYGRIQTTLVFQDIDRAGNYTQINQPLPPIYWIQIKTSGQSLRQPNDRVEENLSMPMNIMGNVGQIKGTHSIEYMRDSIINGMSYQLLHSSMRLDEVEVPEQLDVEITSSIEGYAEILFDQKTGSVYKAKGETTSILVSSVENPLEEGVTMIMNIKAVDKGSLERK